MADFKNYINESLNNIKELEKCSDDIDRAIDTIIKSLESDKKIIFCGNGGSAADSQHLAAELMGRYLIDRKPLPSIALTVDTSALTAIGNDYGYENIFSRQLEGMGHSGDTLIAISTSGNSKNVSKCVQTAKNMGISSIGLTGNPSGNLGNECDMVISVPSSQTNKIQEMHIMVGHYICGAVESTLFK